MKQFVCLLLAIFVAVATANSYKQPSYSAYGTAPAASGVHHVSLAGLSHLVDIAAIERNLNGHAQSHQSSHSASYGPARYIVAASAPSAGPVVSNSYSAAHAPAPAAYGGHHSAGSAQQHNIGGGVVPLSGIHSALPHTDHKYRVLPVHITELHPGKNSYKTFQTPIKYNTVTLPIEPSSPVANLYLPEHAGHGIQGHISSGSY